MENKDIWAGPNPILPVSFEEEELFRRGTD